jgi:hypothetical protein
MTDKTQRIATMSQNVEGAREVRMGETCAGCRCFVCRSYARFQRSREGKP